MGSKYEQEAIKDRVSTVKQLRDSRILPANYSELTLKELQNIKYHFADSGGLTENQIKFFRFKN